MTITKPMLAVEAKDISGPASIYGGDGSAAAEEFRCYGRHEWVETGMSRSWCRDDSCPAEATWIVRGWEAKK